jgi:hypothetical protein
MSTSSAQLRSKCRFCTGVLDPGQQDDMNNKICSSCSKQPEGKRFMALASKSAPAAGGISKPKIISREFTIADRAMIKKLHGFMPAQQLLDLLNERLAADLGEDVLLYTMQQLYAEIGEKSAAPAATDWPSLRKLLAGAKKAGTLQLVNEQLIDDFAVVFSLNARQALSLKDILLAEGRE